MSRSTRETSEPVAWSPRLFSTGSGFCSGSLGIAVSLTPVGPVANSRTAKEEIQQQIVGWSVRGRATQEREEGRAGDGQGLRGYVVSSGRTETGEVVTVDRWRVEAVGGTEVRRRKAVRPATQHTAVGHGDACVGDLRAAEVEPLQSRQPREPLWDSRDRRAIGPAMTCRNE